MEKNFLKAVVVSALIFILYPVFVKWLYPNAMQKPVATSASSAATEAPLTPSQTTYLREAAEATTALFENALYQIEFSTLGGTVTRLFYKGEPGREAFTKTEFFNAPERTGGIFAVNLRGETADLAHTIFKMTRRGEKNETFEFAYELPGQYILTKTFTVRDDKPVIDLTVRIKNLSSRERVFPATVTYGMNHEKDYQKNYGFFDAVAYTEKLYTADLGKLKKKGFAVPEGAVWGGMIKKYFALLVKPDNRIASGSARADGEVIAGTLDPQPLTVAPGSEGSQRFLVYAGPQRYETLKSFGFDFENVFSRGFFGGFKTILLAVLKFFYGFTHNFGWAIVLLTLLIKLVFAPLTHVSYANMKKMQAIQPKMKALQEHYKNDPQKQQRELMELYRRNKVNPVMGCLPMLIQIPIFIAMFRLLPEAIELHGAPFIGWITDLSAPDRLVTFGQSLPLLGWNSLNLLPILMAASQVWYQKTIPQQPGSTPEQAAIMNLMPIFFGFICYNMPSGLTLYWTLQNLFSIIQQVFINRIAVVLHHEDQ
ncbi:MAG TPA: membrane protein insertase YidC [Candidatus Omnitrophota bacterium]|jgi:YidC/Oxa1 family membrane protein insertase|nr:membrane protein insertase YidC [Candidatus Omnitrophota bacterium]